MYTISICTVCMNRLGHLKETLPVNIRQNEDYPSIEFVLLDYNSTDGLQEWMQSEMMPHIDNGTLKYYRTTEPAHWSMNHSRNMALRRAAGEILCLVDADNFAGPGYAAWVNTTFEQYGQDIVITTHQETQETLSDQAGKMAFHRHHFEAIRGFDEAFEGYGMDDVDFIGRLEQQGIVKVPILAPAFMRSIGHSNMDRISNGFLARNLTAIYIAGSSAIGNMEQLLQYTRHHVLYLLKDQTFLEVVYEYQESRSNDPYFAGGWNISARDCKTGTYTRSANGLVMQAPDRLPVIYESREADVLVAGGPTERPVLTFISREGHEDLFITLTMAYSDCRNRMRFEENVRSGTVVNPRGWGRGSVQLNFQSPGTVPTDSR